VTTPQDIALIDAKKGIVMFEKVDVRGARYCREYEWCTSVAIADTMSLFLGPVGRRSWLRSITHNCLDRCHYITLREDLDSGKPTVVSRPDSEFAEMYRQLAGRVAAQLHWQGEVIPSEIAFRAV
jgi:ATP-binding protein involved in chromosome partitioning